MRKLKIKKRKARQAINDYLIDGIPTGRRRYLYVFYTYQYRSVSQPLPTNIP